MTTQTLQPPPLADHKTTAMVLLGCALLFLILQGGLTWLVSRLDQTWGQLIVATTMLIVALLLERLFWGRQPLGGATYTRFGRSIVARRACCTDCEWRYVAVFPHLRIADKVCKRW